MKYVYITLFLLHKADKISSVKVRYERRAEVQYVVAFQYVSTFPAVDGSTSDAKNQ